MHFLHVNEAAEWCREHGMEIEAPFRLVQDPRLTRQAHLAFAPDGRSGLEPSTAEACIRALGDWDACLLWITDYGVWPSSEDWPAFYEARGSRGEPGSLDYKPAHAFVPTEEADLRLFLRLTLENGWDAHLLPARANSSDRRLWISHDGFVDLYSSGPASLSLAAV
jgi:hypothetical protein